MAFNPLDLYLIVSASITVRPLAKMVSAMATVQSNLSTNQSDVSPIALADREQRRWFFLQIVFVLAAGLIAALLSYLAWRAGNKFQDAVRADADVRIAVAGENAARANAEALKANEGLKIAEARIEEARAETAQASKEVAQLTKEAEALRADAEQARANIATAQVDAAQANERTQGLAIEVAEARRRQAEAERALETERLERLKIEEALAPRTIVNSLLMADELRRFAGTGVYLTVVDDEEARELESDIVSVFKQAGWNILGREEGPTLLPDVMVHGQSEAARVFVEHLRANKIVVRLIPFTPPPNTIRLFIGLQGLSHLRAKRDEELFRSLIFREPKNPILKPLPIQIQFLSFTERQQQQFAQTLEKMARVTKYPVQLRCPANNDDACGFAMELGMLLRRSGWEIQNNSVTRDRDFPSGPVSHEFTFPESGIVVAARWLSQNDASMAVGLALEDAGFTVQRMTEIFDPSAPLLVLVSKRP